MIDADLSQIERFTKELGKFAKRAVPFAEQQTMNDAAFDARRNAVDIIKSDFTLRAGNNWTTNSRNLVVVKATKSEPQAVLGHTQQYMEDQEFGKIKVGKGKEGVVIPTSTASGEGLSASPRKRLPRKANAMRAIQLKSNRVTGSNNKQRLLLKVREAVGSGQRRIFHDFGGRKKKGIFLVKGGTKGGLKSRGWPKGANLRMLYDMSQDSVRIPKSPWLNPATEFTQKKMPAMFVRRLEDQVKRQRLFLSKKR